MSKIQPGDFEAFFREVYVGRNPFPWQIRLAQRVCAGNWPKCIALPTAAGKTACIDIAIFALACQANWKENDRTAPRRVFFVVDRRIVVDQAYDHASDLARVLANAKSGIVRRVADTLRSLAGDASDSRPLDYYALRGGMYRENTWIRSPLQPTIIASTVDQIGSRLLFRGYGVSDSLKPLHAALVGNDSLILLDEAHCAQPFDQTMTLVAKYRSWATEPLPAPFKFVTMTATPSDQLKRSEIERDTTEDLSDPVLGPRIKASKPAQLIIAGQPKGPHAQTKLVEELARHATKLTSQGNNAVGVIVNRVATARATAQKLRDDGLDVVLLTGRMRPLDRDAITARLSPLFSGKSGQFDKPMIVVATQCLEVGADLDFHALVTECASLDALRQRFGRLNRVAARKTANAVVIIRGDQTEPTDDVTKQDFVYGNSLAHTWKWLKKHATDNVFDFGVAAVRSVTNAESSDSLSSLNAPTANAAVLLPAHLDSWVQTSPIPEPDPDPSVFLHGPSTGAPDLQVVFRADLGDDPEKWAEIVSICPPSSAEALPVRLDAFKRWLDENDAPDQSSDIEGDRTLNFDDDDQTPAFPRRALFWRGADSKDTRVICGSAQLKAIKNPFGVYIVPIAQGMNLQGLGDFLEPSPPDQGDEAFQRARDRAILRLTPTVNNIPAIADIDIDDDDFQELITIAIESLNDDSRDWIQRAVKSLAKKSNRVTKKHPLGGFVVIGKNRLRKFDPTFSEADVSWESSSPLPYPLMTHCQDVSKFARQFAEKAGLALSEVYNLAGLLHDAGKADSRFQAWLHNGNRRKADAFSQLLAKSIGPVLSREDREKARMQAAYPQGGRHELLSVRFAECDGALPQMSPARRDLILHLIASHHGSCRPFASVVDDPISQNVEFLHLKTTLTASSATGLERIDSGVAERFWSLTRSFGWWGLPWLESMLRLGDWAASETAESNDGSEPVGES